MFLRFALVGKPVEWHEVCQAFGWVHNIYCVTAITMQEYNWREWIHISCRTIEQHVFSKFVIWRRSKLPSLYSIGDRRMIIEQWQNNADRESPKYSARNTSLCHFVHQKAHMDRNEIVPGLLLRQAGKQSPIPRNGLHIFLTDLKPNQSKI